MPDNLTLPAARLQVLGVFWLSAQWLAKGYPLRLDHYRKLNSFSCFINYRTKHHKQDPLKSTL